MKRQSGGGRRGVTLQWRNLTSQVRNQNQHQQRLIILVLRVLYKCDKKGT